MCPAIVLVHIQFGAYVYKTACLLDLCSAIAALTCHTTRIVSLKFQLQAVAAIVMGSSDLPRSSSSLNVYVEMRLLCFGAFRDYADVDWLSFQSWFF